MHKVALVVVALVLGGCDSYYGVSRQARLEHFVDHRCLKAALEQVNGITDIKYQFAEGGRPWTGSGLQAPDQLHYYFFKVNELNGNVYFLVNYEQKTEFHQSYGALNMMPPQEHIDIIRPIMTKIEKEIEISCGIKGFVAKITEHCAKVQCGHLE